MNEQSNKTEIILMLALVIIGGITAFVMTFAEEIAIVLLLAALVFAAWLCVLLIGWIWRFIGNTRHDWADRRLNREILAAQTRSVLMLEDKRSNLVYASDGFLPVAYAQVMDGTNNSRLLELAAQRIETLKLPENVPNHLHVVTQSDTAQTLNAGANVPSATGALGDLSFLTGNQPSRYRVLEETDNDEQQ